MNIVPFMFNGGAILVNIHLQLPQLIENTPFSVVNININSLFPIYNLFMHQLEPQLILAIPLCLPFSQLSE